MKRWFTCVLFLLIVTPTTGCFDVTPIQDGKKYNSVVVIQDWFTSCQLVKTKNSAILFDACFREGTLKDALQKQGMKPSDITHVIFTHGHGDHVGGLKALTNAKVLALAAEQETLTKNAGDRGKIDQVLKDGETLTIDGVSIKVFATPGHTPGSAVYLVDKTLILGDSALIKGNGKLDIAPKDRADDPEQARKSLSTLDERLKREKHEIEWLVPAHSIGLPGQSPLSDYAQSLNK